MVQEWNFTWPLLTTEATLKTSKNEGKIFALAFNCEKEQKLAIAGRAIIIWSNKEKKNKSENCTGSNREKSKITKWTIEFLGAPIVLFKSFRNSKSHNKGNFTSKSNSNKLNLCGWGATLSSFELDFNVIISLFRSLYKF